MDKGTKNISTDILKLNMQTTQLFSTTYHSTKCLLSVKSGNGKASGAGKHVTQVQTSPS